MIDRISIELTQGDTATTTWRVPELIDLVRDCAARGVRAVAFSGGEPLAFAGLFEVLEALHGALHRSVTTSGVLLDDRLEQLVRAAPDVVHLAIHNPGNAHEIARVLRQVHTLAAAGVTSDLYLVVRASRIDDALRAAAHARAAGIDDDRILYLPLPDDSTSAYAPGGQVPVIGWDKHVAWGTSPRSRRPLASPTHVALIAGLAGLGLEASVVRTRTG
jgi:pyruvate-formate lyase-activating enzyme